MSHDQDLINIIRPVLMYLPQSLKSFVEIAVLDQQVNQEIICLFVVSLDIKCPLAIILSHDVVSHFMLNNG